MAAADLTLPLVVIAGPTASGKTSLAIELAQKFDGEIICADSRTVYKGMDIGTAKPSNDEQTAIPHWGLDLTEPGSVFTAADFKQYANMKIREIRTRGRIPFLVGGTGLYIDAVIFDYEFGSVSDPDQRKIYESMTIEQLQFYCHENNIELPENSKNKRYLIRAIEQKSINNKRKDRLADNTIVVAVTTERDVLRTRIKNRIEHMFDDGVVEEATILGKKYGWDNEAMTGNVYRLIRMYLEKQISFKEMIDKNTTLDWRLAKRQLTWLRRNPFIYWGTTSELRNYLMDQLARYR